MSTGLISFPVDAVERAEGTAPQGPLEVMLEWLPGTVAYSATHPTLVRITECQAYSEGVTLMEPQAYEQIHGATDPYHGLAAAAHHAWAYHRPLVLTPDAVWLTILQGFGAHVRENAEALRSHFVSHQDKIDISLRADVPVWDKVIGAFSLRISEFLRGDLHATATAGYSTTGPIAATCHNAALLYAMQDFFRFSVHSMCGIPSVTLEGTAADWQAVRDRAARLGRFDLDWWMDHLLPVLDQFVRAAQGQPEREFWQALYHYHPRGRSGTEPSMSGWLTVFFPYAGYRQKMQRRGVPGHRMETQEIPPGIVRTPFVWECLGESHSMQFVTGLMGAHCDDDGSVRPVLGWAVAQGPR